MHIVLSRTDKIGDVLLTLPMAGFLKSQDPNLRISFLCQSYTSEIVRHSPYVDNVWTWDSFSTISDAANFFAAQNIDVFVHVFPNRSIAQAASKAKIPCRIGTRNRWFHWLYCNHRVALSRRRSAWHESILNLKLLTPLYPVPYTSTNDILSFVQLKPVTNTKALESVHKLLEPNKFRLILHPKSKGSAREWPLAHYQELLSMLPSCVQILVTGGKDEEQILAPLLAHPRVTNVVGKTTLLELMALIDAADGLIAASTGPLHIAATYHKYALGLYPPIPPMHGGRWGPLGTRATFISSGSPSCQLCRKQPSACACMAQITPSQVAHVVLSWLREQNYPV